MPIFAIMLFGALGGTCPTISRLAAYYAANPESPLPLAGTYLALALFAVLGAIIAFGFGAKEARNALIAGIAAPAIVTNILTGASEGRSVEDLSTMALVPPAFAQPADTDPNREIATETLINLLPDYVSGGKPIEGQVRIEWQTDGAVQAAPETIDLSVRQVIAVPQGATGLVINGESVALEDILSRTDNTLQLNVTTRPTALGDLRWALGGQRSYVIENVEIAR